MGRTQYSGSRRQKQPKGIKAVDFKVSGRRSRVSLSRREGRLAILSPPEAFYAAAPDPTRVACRGVANDFL